MEARLGAKATVAPIPADMADDAEEARMALIEAAAEGDDSLMEKYFEEEDLTSEEIVRGLKGAMAQGLVTPIIFSAPEPGIAVEPVLEILASYIPSPDSRSFTATNAAGDEVVIEGKDTSHLAAFIFKTREDPYGRSSYIRVFSGILESDSRVWASHLDSEVRVGTLQTVIGKETTPFHACTAAISA